MNTTFRIKTSTTGKTCESGRMFIRVDVTDLPKDLPMKINPRTQNMRTGTARAIVKSLEQRDPLFEYMNGGLKIVCESLTICKQKAILMITDAEKQGVFDGGHTYRAIIDNVTEDYPKGVVFINVEILYGEQLLSNAIKISAARNTAVAVKTVSVMNALGYFEQIKDVLKNESYACRIRYSENDPQPIKVELLLGLMMCMNIRAYGCGTTAPRSHPTDSYNSKKHATERYECSYRDEDNVYEKLIPLLPEFIRLYEYLQVNIPKMYNRMGGCYGARKVDRFDLTAMAISPFTDQKCQNFVPDAYVFPILASLRFCLREVDDKIEWVVDPFKVLETIGDQVVYNYLQELTDFCQSKTGGRPGPNIRELLKTNTVWKSVYSDMVGEWGKASY